MHWMWQVKFGRCIYTSPAGYKVYENCRYRWLTFGNDILQTVINKKHPQRLVLSYAPLLTLGINEQSQHACLLGLGGGAIPLMLSARYPGLSMDVVEQDQEVIDIAKQYFFVNQAPPLMIHRQHAYAFLSQIQQFYDHLLVDIYGACRFPEDCLNRPFFQACREALKPEGLFAINLASLRFDQGVIKWVQEAFQHTIIIPVKNCANIVMFATNKGHRNDFLEYISQQGKLSQITWVSGYGYVGAKR